MPKLPVCSGAQALEVFRKFGWTQDRQKGSHVSMVKSGSFVVLTIPLHPELDRGLLRALIRKAGLTVARFVSTLNTIR